MRFAHASGLTTQTGYPSRSSLGGLAATQTPAIIIRASAYAYGVLKHACFVAYFYSARICNHYCLLSIVHKQMRQTLGIHMHQIRVRSDAVPRRGAGARPPLAARRAGERRAPVPNLHD